MLDTHGRKYVEPLIKRIASIFLKYKMNANEVTILAFFTGISTGFLVYFNMIFTAVVLLWISGLLDAVDGSIARKQNKTSAWGTLMDITFDRIVEISIIIGLALKFPNARLQLIILCSSIIFSMTVFLTVGALSNQKGIKSFYYQAGVAERTEGFILFTFMIIYNEYLVYLSIIFSILVIITGIQRMLEAKRLFSNF